MKTYYDYMKDTNQLDGISLEEQEHMKKMPLDKVIEYLKKAVRDS